MLTNKLYPELLQILLWIGIWGIIENLMDKYIQKDKYNLRIVLFAGMVLIAITLQYWLRKSNCKRDNNSMKSD